MQEGGCGVAGTGCDFVWVRSRGDAKKQADHQIAPEQSTELAGELSGTSLEQARRLSLGHDVTQGGAAGLTAYGVQRPRHFRRVHGLGNGQAEYRNDRGVGYFAEELRPEGRQQAQESLAIAGHGQTGRSLEPPSAPADAGDQHLLLVSNLGVKLSLGNVRTRGDLQRGGARVSILHEGREGRIQDARTERGFVAVYVALF